MNGFAIAGWVRQTTGGDVELEEGARYPALHRMEHRGWLESEWRRSEKKRRAKYYSLTPEGRRMLAARTESLERLVRSVAAVLHTEARPA
jgi:DNA-binding PadR family transcriptional regulator